MRIEIVINICSYFDKSIFVYIVTNPFLPRSSGLALASKYILCEIIEVKLGTYSFHAHKHTLSSPADSPGWWVKQLHHWPDRASTHQLMDQRCLALRAHASFSCPSASIIRDEILEVSRDQHQFQPILMASRSSGSVSPFFSHFMYIFFFFSVACLLTSDSIARQRGHNLLAFVK